MLSGDKAQLLERDLARGRLGRREFIRRAAALGLSASAIAGALAACGGETPTATNASASAPTGVPTRAATPAPAAPTGVPTRAATPAPAASAPPAPRAATATTGGGAATPRGGATASPVGSPAAGIGALGTATSLPLGAGGGLGPGPTRRGGGGTLKMLWWQAPTILNPHLAQGTKDYDAARVTYEPLAAFGPDERLVPFLAAEIPTRANGGVGTDAKSVTWKLKRDVKWSDGRPFTAADVAFTFRYVTDKDTASVSQGVYRDVANVEALDDHTVRVTFKESTPAWYVPFVGSFGYILPEHIFREGLGAAAKTFPGNLKPVGTGPYRVVEFKPGDLVTYDINPFWRAPDGPFFDQVLMKGGGDAVSAARAVLQTGDYQVAWNLQIEPAILNQLQKGGKGKLVQVPNGGIERILIQFADPYKEVDGERAAKSTRHPFQTERKVREAYTYLCDRKTIAEQLYGQGGEATANILTNPKVYASPNTGWTFDIGRAEQLLEEAGYKKSGQYRAKDGVQLSVLFQTSTNSVRQKHQQIVKDALEKAGIKTELKTVDAGVYFGSDAGNTDNTSHFYADLEMYTNSNDSPDPWTYFQGWTTAEIAQKENSWNGSNYHRWSNPEYDRLVAQAKSELDEQKRAQLFIRMNDILVKDDIVLVPQVDRLGIRAFANGMESLHLTAWDVTTWNIANWIGRNSG